MKTFKISGLMAFVTACVLAGTAHAQAWPNKPVKFIVPLPAGSAVDIVARIIGEKLTPIWGQGVVIENRAGAGGIPAMSAFVRSPADGYTFGLVVATVATLTPHLYKNPQYNLDTDVVPVATIGTSPMMMATTPATGVNNFADFVKLAKSQPGKLNFAIPLPNSTPHLAGEMVSAAAGMKLHVVPYNGSTAAVTSALAGESQLVVDGLPALVPHIKAGKLRAIAVTSRQRLPGYEQVPSVSETYPGVQAIGWFNLLAVKGTPQPVIEKANADINTVLKMPDVVAKLADLGVYATPGSVKDAADFMASERAMWGKIVKDLGLQPQ
ncbi:MAG: tripartite tricarboxylate transporter substrate-binding protein [Pseudomonadota bacterium]